MSINLNSIGNVSSIIGLIITCFILFTVKHIKNHYIFIARIPELKNKLKAQASKIIELQSDYSNNRKEIILELARSAVTLKFLSKKLRIQNKATIKKAINLIKIFRRKTKENRNTDVESQDVYDIYTEIQLVLDELIESIKDNKWER